MPQNTHRRTVLILVLGGACLLLLGGIWKERHVFTGTAVSSAVTLPPAQPFQPVIATTPEVVSSSSSIQHQKNKKIPAKAVQTATSTNPLVWNGPLPASVNLAVPFLSQAPTGNWALPYQEACEEASLIMVNAYESGRTQAFSSTEGDAAIVALTNFSGNMFQGRTDTSAQETGEFGQAFFPHRAFIVAPVHSVQDIQRVLANGYPVIVPADGKALHNPHFHNGGPVYHMLVIKGYTADGRWIMNDSGTQYGANYLYDRDVLMNAIHDWNGGDVPHGQAVMLLFLPTH